MAISFGLRLTLDVGSLAALNATGRWLVARCLGRSAALQFHKDRLWRFLCAG
jgi:hypothetical protein